MPAAAHAATAPPVTRCLSICQPFAWAVAAGYKSIENRTWSTPYRGLVAIHASQSRRHCNEESERFFCEINHPGIAADVLRRREDLWQFGAIIGVAELVEVMQFVDVAKLPAGPDRRIAPTVWAEGPLCWLFRGAVLFDRPIECKGKLNLWSLDERLRRAVRAAHAKRG